jgi:D-glutamate cyclase
MPPHPAAETQVGRIECLVQADVGRNINALCVAARGGLWRAASQLAAARPCRIGLITGFFVPLGSPPAAETDGPVGAALLARGLMEVGIACRLVTDEPCRNACAVALAAADASNVPVDAVTLGGGVAPLIASWRGAGVTHSVTIERCGRSRDGTPRNMRGEDISTHTVLLDDLFTAGPWDTIAIGDGGNEIGMGALPRALIARHVEHGATIACVTPAHQLVVAGVSHWGAYALIGALAVIRQDWRDRLLQCLDAGLEQHILEATISRGPAVDGVSRRQALTIDNFNLAFHQEKMRMVKALVEGVDEV